MCAMRQRGLVSILVVGLLFLMHVPAFGFTPPPPEQTVRLTQTSGHLMMESALSPGTHRFEVVGSDDTGIRATVCVSPLGEELHSVRLFRLSGRSIADGNEPDSDQRREFAVTVKPSTSPDHFTIRFAVKDLSGDVTREQEAIVGKTCCGYYLSVRQGDEKSKVTRGKTLVDLQTQDPVNYGRFEELARCCSCAGFDLVPSEPGVLDQVTK